MALQRTRVSARSRRVGALGLLAALALVATVGTSAMAAPVPGDGDTVWIGAQVGYGGTAMYAVYLDEPVDPQNPGEPDYWSYCIEHDVSALTNTPGHLGDASSYLGENYYGDTGIPGKVLWVLAHSYPALSLTEFAAASGVAGISENDAIEATQYAIWRYTDVGYDAAWAWETEDSEDTYWYLVDGANASSGLTPADVEATVSIIGPAVVQKAGGLVGPFIVSTNRPSATVVADPAFALTDASGAPIDTSDVTDGQELYLDLRTTTTAGSAVITASVLGSSATGLVISVPTDPGETPTTADHAQSQILVTPSGGTTDADIAVTWAAAPQLAATGGDTALSGLLVASLLFGAGAVAVLVRRRPAQR